MDAWNLFRRARIILFAVLVFLCLAWAIIFAVSIAREWHHYASFQRAIMLGLLVVHAFTAILLYLMIVVPFRLWLDFARVFMLLLSHIGSAVLYTLFNSEFPCGNPGSEETCRDLNYIVFIGCWVISGIIIGYAIALCIMSSRPRPVESLSGKPEIDLQPATPKARSIHSIQRESQTSVSSRTGLLDRNRLSVIPVREPRTLIVINGDPYNSPPGNMLHPQPSQQPAWYTGNSSPPGHLAISQATPRSKTSAASPRGLSTAPRQSVNLLPFPNPFRDPVPRFDSPASVYSTSTIRSDLGLRGRGGSDGSITFDHEPPTPPQKALDRGSDNSPPPYGAPPPHAGFPTYTPTLHRSHSDLYSSLNTYSFPTSPSRPTQPTLPRTLHLVPNRANTTTPAQSIHSLAASMHLTQPPAPATVPTRPGRRSAFLRLHPPPTIGPAVHSYNAPFGTRGPAVNIIRRYGSQGHSPLETRGAQVGVNDVGQVGERRGSDGQVLDEGSWRRLVMNAAGRP